ncbi:MAG TPA: spore germination protein [Bacillota bacterium]
MSSKIPSPDAPEERLSPDLDRNLAWIRDALCQSPDLVIRNFIIRIHTNIDRGWEAAVAYIDGLADNTVINDHILRPLMGDTIKLSANQVINPEKNLLWIEDHLITANDLSRITTLNETIEAIIKGDTVLLVQNSAKAIQISSKGWEKRAISEPQSEVIIKGPRDGFIENLRTNTALLRRKIGDPHLTFESMRIGRQTRTDLNLAYIRGIARDDLVAEVRRRIRRIDTDAILSGSNIMEFIEDAPFSLFPTTAYTERPDVAAAKLLEGRVAIMVDGTPTVYTVPALFVESFQSPDDYHFRPYYITLIRWIRFLAFAFTVFLPAFYVALTTFHQELIPTPLLITIAAATDTTPFPVVIETLGTGILFEVLREAGLRIPRAFGPAVSIVGGLVIGEAAVGAGLVGEPMVVVTALTAIASYVVPFQAEVNVFLRLGLTIIAGFFGLYGIFNGTILILIHLASLRSFGIPFLSPLAPLMASDLKDVIIRAPQWALLTRPRSLEPKESGRQKFGSGPKHPGKNDE